MHAINLTGKENIVSIEVKGEEYQLPLSSTIEEKQNLAAQLWALDSHAEIIIARLPADSKEILHTSFKQFCKLLSEELNLPVVFTTKTEVSQQELTQAIEENPWKVSYYGYQPGKDEYAAEALLTTGNGFIGLRGTTPEMTISDACYPATYLAGVYNETISTVAGEEITNEDFVNAPNLQGLKVAVEGEVLNFNQTQVLELERTLDLRSGLFHSHALFQTKKGQQLVVTTEKFVSMANRHQYGLRYRVVPVNFSGVLQLISEADGEVYNYNVPRYRSLNQQHLVIDTAEARENQARLAAHTTASNLTILQESKLMSAADLTWTNEITGKKITQTADVFLEKNQSVTVEKLVYVDVLTTDTPVENVSGISSLTSFDSLYQASNQAWGKLWEEAKIEITGDMMSAKLLHLHTYHLLVSGSPLAAKELDTSVTARGLHGEAYRGHIFWDELFILPFYILHFPDTARELLMYRYRRLKAAKTAAQEAGYEGAMYPWQSGLDGSEQSQKIHLNPVSGKWDEDHSRLQRHVSLAVAYNYWLYYENTKDTDFMNDYGMELLLEVAKFWLSIAVVDFQTKRYSIAGVMGPDEFHEAYPNADEAGLTDNAYTNMMVVWLFEEVQQLFAELPEEAIVAAKAKTNFTPEDSTKMDRIMHQLHLEINEEGIIAQFAGYFNLKKVDWAYYKEKYGNIHRMDRILRAEGFSADEYQVAKQPDSLMMFYNFGKGRIDRILADLGYQLPEDYLERNLDYYLARTSHGSTLSRVVHAQLAEMVGDEDLSWQMYQEALYSDYKDIQGGTTAEGIHSGVMAATLYVTLTTYGGIDVRENMLRIEPKLPRQWQKLKFNLIRRGIRYQLVIYPDRFEILADKNTVIAVQEQEIALYKNQVQTVFYTGLKQEASI